MIIFVWIALRQHIFNHQKEGIFFREGRCSIVLSYMLWTLEQSLGPLTNLKAVEMMAGILEG